MTDDEKAFFEALGQRLVQRRREIGLTQQEVGDAVGCSAQMVAHYEAGRRRAPASLLPPLSEVLNVPVDELLGVKPSTPRQPRTQFERQLRAINKLSRGKQEMVFNMIDAAIETATRR